MNFCLLLLVVLFATVEAKRLGETKVRDLEACDDCTTCEGNLVSNCSFESGDYTRWITKDMWNPILPMSVVDYSSPLLSGDATAGLFPLGAVAPSWGDYTAVNGFDGDAIDHILLQQDVVITGGDCELQFHSSGYWNQDYLFDETTAARRFDVYIEQPPGNKVFTETILGRCANKSSKAFCGHWVSYKVDPLVPITGVSPGPARLVFDWFVVPDWGNPPQQSRLDNVILRCQDQDEQLQLNAFTKASTGGVCYFDESKTDCAICFESLACQCGPDFRSTCVECSRGTDCAKEHAAQRGLTTKAPCTNFYSFQSSGAPCWYDSSDTSCAVCENHGCQCGPGMGFVCIECGTDSSQCSMAASEFSGCAERY